MSNWWIEEKGAVTRKRGASIDEVKREVSIRQMLEYYGADLPVYHSTGWVSIKCPFHVDSRPSASYNEKLARFNCHTCDVGGDIIDIVTWREGIELKDAIEWIRWKMMH